MSLGTNKSVDAALSIALFLLYISTTIHAVLVYKQFDIISILLVSIAFLGIFLSLLYSFGRDMPKYAFGFSFCDFFLGIFIFLILFMLAMPPDGWVSGFYPSFPLLRGDLGAEINRDALYHVAIIQSILSFGYPSIAQHDVPVVGYHVLSHYVDAAVIWFSGVEAFDSYGMFFYFKVFLLVSIAAVFIRNVTNKLPNYIFFLSIFIIPSYVWGYSWHAIISHSLWFTSLLLIISAPKVFSILVGEKLDNKDYFFYYSLFCFCRLGRYRLVLFMQCLSVYFFF